MTSDQLLLLLVFAWESNAKIVFKSSFMADLCVKTGWFEIAC